MKYAILKYKSLNEMIFQVNKSIREGWRPQGGVSAIFPNALENSAYIQAMVLDEEDRAIEAGEGG